MMEHEAASRKGFAKRWREFAQEYNRIHVAAQARTEWDRIDILEYGDVDARAGRLLVQSYQAGFLPATSRLQKRIEWHSGQLEFGDHPPSYAQCMPYLWREAATMKETISAGPVLGGASSLSLGGAASYHWKSLLTPYFPELFDEETSFLDVQLRSARPEEHSKLNQLRLLHDLQHFANVCERLAILVEDKNFAIPGLPADEQEPATNRKRGRPQNRDPKADEKIFRDWQSAKVEGSSMEAFATGRGITMRQVELAIESHRKRSSRG